MSLGVVGMIAGATVLGLGAHRSAGLMVLAVAPTLFATGVSLLVHRARTNRLSVAPMMSRRVLGVTTTVRF